MGGFIEPELTPELVQQGWRKFWSKRENRPYFWNKITGESLWEMPSLKQPVSIGYVTIAQRRRVF